jgi:hypothetical protein
MKERVNVETITSDFKENLGFFPGDSAPEKGQ